ncbi:MAG: hypothetical protein IPH75_08020 [bacterium]|nr:hypothetical protein [bacterium]
MTLELGVAGYYFFGGGGHFIFQGDNIYFQIEIGHGFGASASRGNWNLDELSLDAGADLPSTVVYPGHGVKVISNRIGVGAQLDISFSAPGRPYNLSPGVSLGIESVIAYTYTWQIR